jgi:hypothetical protein
MSYLLLHKQGYIRAAFAVSMLIVTTNVGFAQDLYKQQDESGRLIYRSHPKDERDRPHVLPPLVRQEAPKLRDTSCTNHGGYLCDAGPDEDGSVICADGYRDAQARFNFQCRTARLSVVHATVSAEGLIRVVIRNLSQAEAVGISVEYRHQAEGGLRAERLLGVGAHKIKGFESGEYLFKVSNSLGLNGDNVVDKIDISCENCG